MADIICLAGFGDNSSMFQPLLGTPIAQRYSLDLMNLPGFGAPPAGETVTLSAMAKIVEARVRSTGARIVMAHSVASVIAVKAAQLPRSPIRMILSLEGNLTAEDAYFSGTAADYDTPAAFRAAFLQRLEGMSDGAPEIARYRDIVAAADPRSLWELGCDAHRYSSEHVPGDDLMAACRAAYFYNPENLPAASLQWLEQSALPRFELRRATHWMSMDQPELLSEKMMDQLSST